MSYKGEAGRIFVSRSDGQIALDTGDGSLFHTLSEIAGSVSINAVGALSTFRNQTDTYALGPCHPACTHVIGDVYFSGSGAWAIKYSRWVCYAGGDLLWALTAPGLTAGTAGRIYTDPHTGCKYRFYCSGGQVWLERRLCMASVPSGVSYGFEAHTIYYDFDCGLFTA